MSNIWFTSDTHFCHDKLFIWQNRGYNSIEAMNADLINKWNSIVGKNDIVYHLGDVVLNDTVSGLEILSTLNGRIHIIAGNHDTDQRLALYQTLPNVDEISFANRLKISKRHTFFLSHYPSLIANFDDHKKIWNLSGHTHTTDKFALKQSQVYNVGVDAHNGFPVNIDDIRNDIIKLQRGIV